MNCVWCSHGITTKDRACLKCGGPNVYFLDLDPSGRTVIVPGSGGELQDDTSWWTAVEGWNAAHYQEIKDGLIPMEICPDCHKPRARGRTCSYCAHRF